MTASCLLAIRWNHSDDHRNNCKIRSGKTNGLDDFYFGCTHDHHRNGSESRSKKTAKAGSKQNIKISANFIDSFQENSTIFVL